jgi:RimJ/RimL family protein N-acetyltransferase
MRILLETERLVLRRFTMADVDHLVELDGDPEVMRFLTGGRPTARGVIEGEVLPRFLDYYARSDGLGFWAGEDRVTGEFIGWFELRPTDDVRPHEVELGYRLVRSVWGRGYATEGSRALVDKAFADLGVERVVATTMTVNLGSRRVMEKVGLTLVRTFHESWPDPIDGAEHGDVEYALSKAEWERRRAAVQRRRFRSDR